jgi:hypothetical protein
MIKSRRMRWVGHVARIITAYKILVGKPERKRRIGWEDNIKMGLREIGWEVVD